MQIKKEYIIYSLCLYFDLYWN